LLVGLWYIKVKVRLPACTQSELDVRTEDKLEGVGDGEREEVTVGGVVHVRVPCNDDARDDVADDARQ